MTERFTTTDAGNPVEANAFILFQNDVDDPTRTCGVKLGRRIGDQFYLIDMVRGNLVEGKDGRPSINEYLRGSIAQFHVAFNIDGYGWNIFHDINGRSAIR